MRLPCKRGCYTLKAKLKLAEVVPELLPVPPVKGGAVETLVYDLAKLLSDKFDVTVVSRPSGTKPNDGLSYINIPSTRADRLCLSIKERLPKSNPLRHAAKIQNVYQYSKKAAQALGSKFDIIHIHNEPNMVPLMRKFNPRSLIVLHMHNDHLVEAPLFRMRYKRILRNVDLVLCVSNYIRSRIIGTYPEFRKRCITVYNGIDTGVFCPKGRTSALKVRRKYNIGDSKMILYVGRLVPDKGVHILLEAMKQVVKKYPDAKLVICGSSWFGRNSKTPYQRLLEEKGSAIAGNVVFTGYVDHAYIPGLYSAADVFVCPSVWNEPFALVSLEAMSCGTPVVITKVGGIPEAVPENYPYLAAPGDPGDLAKKIVSVLSASKHKPFRERMRMYYDKRRFAKKVEMILMVFWRSRHENNNPGL